MKKQIRKYKNYIIPIIITIILSFITVSAGLYLSDSNSKYLQGSNNGNYTTMNESGIYFNNNKAFSRTADVVVCSATLLNYIQKLFQCDYVCIKGNDCKEQLQQCNGKTCYLYGDFDLLTESDYTYTSNLLFIGKSFLNYNISNTKIYGFNATININYYNSLAYKQTAISIVNTSDILINDVNIIGNGRSPASSSTHDGITILNSQNINIENNFINNVSGFLIRILSSQDGITNNIKIYNNDVYGIGNRDVIGSELLDNGNGYLGSLNNIKIKDNLVVQRFINGSYSGGIQLACVENSYIIHNFVNGDVGTSHEYKPSYIVTISENILDKPLNSNYYATLDVLNLTSSNHIITNNIIIKGKLLIYGNNHTISNNKILNNSLPSDINGNNHIIFDNDIKGLNLYLVYIRGNHNKIKDNVFSGGSRTLTILGNDTTIINNDFYNVVYGGGYTVAISLDNSERNAVNFNNLYLKDYQFTTSFILASDTNNSEFIGNNIFNQGSMTDLLRFRNNAGNNFVSLNNIFVNTTITKYDVAGLLNTNFIDDNLYTTLPLCSSTSLTLRRIVSNITSAYFCNGSTWNALY